MEIRKKAVSVIVTITGLVFVSGCTNAQQTAVSPLVGVWNLVAFESRADTGDVSYPMGEHPIGLLTYDAKGRVANQLMQPNRPAFKSGDRRRGSPEEIKSAFEGFSAYYGTYRIDEKQGKVMHRIEASSFPNEVGTEVERFFEISGRRLTLRTPARVFAGQAGFSTLVWERVE